MSEPFALFTHDGDVYRATTIARSRWSASMVGGFAVCAMLAHELEPHCPPDFVPARLGVEMFNPVPADGVTVTTSVVRAGNRIAVVDATVWDGEREVTRASATFLRQTEDPPGTTWSRQRAPEPPPLALHPVTPGLFVPWFASGDDWSESMGVLQGPGRKRMWQNGIPVLEGAGPTAFERAAMIADAASMVTHWGSEGVGFINCDVQLALCRLPDDAGIGIEADDRVSHAGVSFGVATVYDRRGVIGTVHVSALANARRQVDLSGVGTYTMGRQG
ncbi:MAG TPA: acyl-CoA thioesterase domain-containing protein [Marmoricola sp.]